MKKSLKITYQDNYFTGLDANSCFWWQEMILHSFFPCILSIKNSCSLPQADSLDFWKSKKHWDISQVFQKFLSSKEPCTILPEIEPKRGKVRRPPPRAEFTGTELEPRAMASLYVSRAHHPLPAHLKWRLWLGTQGNKTGDEEQGWKPGRKIEKGWGIRKSWWKLKRSSV